jgi:hypothetical protein
LPPVRFPRDASHTSYSMPDPIWQWNVDIALTVLTILNMSFRRHDRNVLLLWRCRICATVPFQNSWQCERHRLIVVATNFR